MISIDPKDYEVFLNTQKANLKSLTLENIPLSIKYINALLPDSADWYKKEVAELDNRIFGPKGMFSPPWIDITFSGMAGAAVGLKEKNGQVVSISRFCGCLEQDKVQLWTLLTYPKVQGKGFGTYTLALFCALNQKKTHFQYITQIENPAIRLYLKLITPHNPLILTGVGFYHSQMPNSISLSSKIPENPFKELASRTERPNLDNAHLIEKFGNKEIPLNSLVLMRPASRMNALISQDILRGATYHVLWWLKKEEAAGFGSDAPLLVIKKIGSLSPLRHNGNYIG